MKPRNHIPLSPLRIVLLYVFIAGLWILFSDRLLASIVHNPSLLTRLQTYKGWLFVLVTGGLLYWMLRRYRDYIIITEQRRGQLLRLFIDHSPAAIAMFDKEMRYVAASRRFKIDYGLGDLDLTGRSHYEVFPEMPERWKEIHRRCLAGAVEKCDEDPFPRKDGKTDWVRWEIRPWYERENEIGGIILFSEVITDRKTAEMELEKYRKHLEDLVKERTAELEAANTRLKELDRLKSMFIASMSHELRTPLNSIIGYSSILLHEWSGPLNKDQKAKLTSVIQSGRHLLSLINDVIDVSKIEAGSIDVVVEDFDLYDLITEVRRNLEKDAADKGLLFSTEAVHLNMRTDRRRLLQCVLNLVSNAVKFTESGSVRLSTRRVQGYEPANSEPQTRNSSLIIPASSPPDDFGFVEIAVEDTGIGIRKEDTPRLFQSFVRLDSPLKTKVPGTGLGLYLTKRLVTEVLKGKIDVESEPGKGSRFDIIIPISIPEPADEKGPGNRGQ